MVPELNGIEMNGFEMNFGLNECFDSVCVIRMHWNSKEHPHLWLFCLFLLVLWFGIEGSIALPNEWFICWKSERMYLVCFVYHKSIQLCVVFCLIFAV